MSSTAAYPQEGRVPTTLKAIAEASSHFEAMGLPLPAVNEIG